MQAGAGVSDLRARHERRAFRDAGWCSCAAHGLRDVFYIGLEIGVRTRRAKPLMEPIIDARMISWMRSQTEAEAVKDAGAEVSITMSHFLSSSTKISLPSGDFIFHCDGPLVAVQHREVEAVAFGTSRSCPRVASPAGDSKLDDVGSHPCEQLRGGGSACTCVMSRMRMPFNASIYLSGPFVKVGLAESFIFAKSRHGPH